MKLSEQAKELIDEINALPESDQKDRVLWLAKEMDIDVTALLFGASYALLHLSESEGPFYAGMKQLKKVAES